MVELDISQQIIGDIPKDGFVKFGVEIQSLSSKNTYKVIWNTTGDWSCTCPDFLYRKKRKGKCKHIKAVINLVE